MLLDQTQINRLTGLFATRFYW